MKKKVIKSQKQHVPVINLTSRDEAEVKLVTEYAELNGLQRATALKMFIRRYLPKVIETEKSILKNNQIVHDALQFT